MDTNISAEHLMHAPSPVVYACLANYREHHRPGGFLPPAFTSLQVLHGGYGAGSVIRFTVRLAGRTRTMTHQVTEPQPGRVLVEADDAVRTVFTVEPHGSGCRVRIDTRMQAGGIEGLVNRLCAPALMRPLYADELRRLDAYAQAQATAALTPA